MFLRKWQQDRERDRERQRETERERGERERRRKESERGGNERFAPAGCCRKLFARSAGQANQDFGQTIFLLQKIVSKGFVHQHRTKFFFSCL